MFNYFPPQAYLGLTYFCNLKCKHCYVNKKTMKDISKTRIKRLIKELADLGVFKIVFTHGESLIRRDVFEIISFCYNLDIDTTLITNGLLLNNEYAKKLKKAKVTRIVISFDSLSKKYHNNLRGRSDSWDGAISAMNNCRNNSLRFGLNVTINKSNYRNLEKIILFAIEKGAQDIYFLTIRANKGYDIGQKGFLNKYPGIIYKLWKLKQKYKSKIDLAFHDPLAIPSLAGKIKQSEMKSVLVENQCQAGRSWISIKPTGEINPCNFLSLNLGNAYRSGIKNIWENIDLKNFMLSPKICYSCVHKKTCKGGCKSFCASSGDKDWRCNLLFK